MGPVFSKMYCIWELKGFCARCGIEMGYHIVGFDLSMRFVNNDGEIEYQKIYIYSNWPLYTFILEVTNKILWSDSLKRPHKGVHLSLCLWGHMSLTLRSSSHPLSLPPLKQVLIKTMSLDCTMCVTPLPYNRGAGQSQHQAEVDAQVLPGQRCNQSRHYKSASLQGEWGHGRYGCGPAVPPLMPKKTFSAGKILQIAEYSLTESNERCDWGRIKIIREITIHLSFTWVFK